VNLSAAGTDGVPACHALLNNEHLSLMCPLPACAVFFTNLGLTAVELL